MPFLGNAQNSFHNEFQFLNYLINNHQLHECDIELRKVDAGSLSAQQKDSLAYIWGWKNYSAKELLQACNQWKNISSASPFYLKTNFFTAYNQTFLGNIAASDSILFSLNCDSIKLLQATKKFEIAGNFLLQKNYKIFDETAKKFDTTFYQLANQQSLLIKYAHEQKHLQHRSPAVAAALSALLPGLGKIYAGKAKQGIASMLPMAVLGAITWECYHKGGIESAAFITSGSIFSLFYFGNIMGSAFAVKIVREEKQNAIENKILLDLHIPLRNIFN